MTTFADIVIVGAGAMGCSTAFHLGQRKGPRVIVLEKGPLVSGMTKRSGALVHANYPTEPESKFAHSSLTTFQNWKEIVGGNCGFTKTGCVTVSGDAHATRLKMQVENYQRVGINLQLLSPNELRELQPGISADDVVLAAYEPDGGFVDPMMMTQSLATRAKELGITFKTGTFAKSILVDNGRVRAIDTTVGLIETLDVIVMAGSWSDRLLKPLGIDLGMQNARSAVAFFDRPAELKSGHIACIDEITGIHFRPHTYGMTMAGLNSPTGEPQKNPDQFDETVSSEYTANLKQRMSTRIPSMTNARFIRGHAGLNDMTQDGRAIIGKMRGIRGLTVAAGFSGTGLALAPAVGQAVCELVCDGETRLADLTPFQLERFGK